MPKAGRYDYPFYDLDRCVNDLRRSYENSKEHVMKRDNFAASLKMSSKGGGFGMLIGSMAMFGLVETGEGDVRITELGKTIIHGEPNEVIEAKSKAVRNIRILTEIYDKYGSNYTDDQLRLFLREKAVVDISEANSLAVEIGKLLKKVVQYIKPIGNAAEETESGGEREGVKVPESNTLTEQYKLGSGIEIKLPKENTVDAWNKAKRALNIILGVDENVEQK